MLFVSEMCHKHITIYFEAPLPVGAIKVKFTRVRLEICS